MLLAMLLTMSGMAQQRNINLTINVSTVPGDNLAGETVTLFHTDYQVSYGDARLDASGKCDIKVYPGPHRLEIDHEGFVAVKHDFTVAETPAGQSVAVTLQEKTRTPFALKADVMHDAFTGRNDIDLSWNTEAPTFFDDFESYDPFAIEFGQWTGIDADGEAAAPLVGSYPNRGVRQYAQIINPLTVTPTWWYEYPILRPYSGQQYVGFTRTNSGNANNDWLISPPFTPGNDNVLSFMAKAADRYDERFMVYITTQTDAPTPDDFVRLDKGNYETADYKGWREFTYDLAEYAGRKVKFAIRYVSHANNYGAFMLMLDDVYVGQPRYEGAKSRAVRAQRSPANKNERFNIYLDGARCGSTDSYSYLLTDVAPGRHTLGVEAIYLQTTSETTNTEIDIPADYCSLVFNVTADSRLDADGQKIDLVCIDNAQTYTIGVTGGKATISSLPHGNYEANIAEGAFQAWSKSLVVDGPAKTVDVQLADNVIDPYNITANQTDQGVELQWNQKLSFNESFEGFDDFVSGEFGGWHTYDCDKRPVYPIGLGSTTNIVSFPGSGDAGNPTAIPPMVFNPWHTVPAMLPTDPAIQAPDGDKTVIFFSPQADTADKWLISPEFQINEGYTFSITAKAYSSVYAESMELCVATYGDQPGDFTPLATIDRLTAEQWTRYSTPLDHYVGQTVRLAVHYTSHDAFLAQVDNFCVGLEDGSSEVVDYGNVVKYEIYVDGQLATTAQTPGCILAGLTPGSHTVGIKAIYKNSASNTVEYTINVASLAGIDADARPGKPRLYDIAGRPVDTQAPQPGIYIETCGGSSKKVIIP